MELREDLGVMCHHILEFKSFFIIPLILTWNVELIQVSNLSFRIILMWHIQFRVQMSPSGSFLFLACFRDLPPWHISVNITHRCHTLAFTCWWFPGLRFLLASISPSYLCLNISQPFRFRPGSPLFQTDHRIILSRFHSWLIKLIDKCTYFLSLVLLWYLIKDMISIFLPLLQGHQIDWSWLTQISISNFGPNLWDMFEL